MKIGFIGCGNMAGALIGGILEKQLAAAQDITVSAPHEETIRRAEEAFGVNGTTDNRTAAAGADILFLAVKPQFYGAVSGQIADVLHTGQTIVSIAPGITIAQLKEWLGGAVHIVRTMPNTPAMVGEGVTAVCADGSVPEDALAAVTRLLEACGQVVRLPERLMNATVALSGSSPAYVFMMIEAMADGGVRDGIPRETAYRMAAQTILGSAKLYLEKQLHPAALKDMVCSPAGTTIEAVAALEKNGFRNAVLEAMKACSDRTRSF